MFQRVEYKKRAWNLLRETYWLSFAVCLVAGLLTGGISYITSRPAQPNYSRFVASNLDWGSLFIISGAIIIVGLIVFVVSYAYLIFVAYPIQVGKNKFFLEARKGNKSFGLLFSSFKENRYLDVVKGMAWMLLFQYLWTLCFIIPGIIKAYSYSMTPFILADNPSIGYQRALKLSMQMTDGYKWNIFVLQLSYIGWYLLGILCCGIGTLFVSPYYIASLTETYAALRKNAMEKGYCTPAELNLTQGDYYLDYPQFPGTEKY